MPLPKHEPCPECGGLFLFDNYTLCPYCGAVLQGASQDDELGYGHSYRKDANLIVERGTKLYGTGIGSKVVILLNGERKGKIAFGGCEQFTLPPGHYTLQFKMDWLKSETLEFDLGPGLPRVIAICDVGLGGPSAYLKE